MANSAFDGIDNLTYATQAQQETASSTSVAVSPANQHYQPSSSKAWVLYDQGTPTVVVSYNITSVTDTGTGDFTVNIATDFSSASYHASSGTGSTGSTIYQTSGAFTSAPTAGAMRFGSFNNSASPTDLSYNSVVFYGDQ